MPLADRLGASLAFDVNGGAGLRLAPLSNGLVGVGFVASLPRHKRFKNEEICGRESQAGLAKFARSRALIASVIATVSRLTVTTLASKSIMLSL